MNSLFSIFIKVNNYSKYSTNNEFLNKFNINKEFNNLIKD